MQICCSIRMQPTGRQPGQWPEAKAFAFACPCSLRLQPLAFPPGLFLFLLLLLRESTIPMSSPRSAGRLGHACMHGISPQSATRSFTHRFACAAVCSVNQLISRVCSVIRARRPYNHNHNCSSHRCREACAGRIRTRSLASC